jgi:hypothetical protein
MHGRIEYMQATLKGVMCKAVRVKLKLDSVMS